MAADDKGKGKGKGKGGKKVIGTTSGGPRSKEQFKRKKATAKKTKK